MILNKEKLFLLRASQCLTVRELAKKASVSPREISKNAPIGAVPAGKIAKALGVPVEEIVMTDAKYSNEQKPGDHEEVRG